MNKYSIISDEIQDFIADILPTPVQPGAPWQLEDIIQGLRQSREHTQKIRFHGQVRELPSRETMSQIMDGLAAVLFPTHYGRPDLSEESIDYFVGATLH
ncbi:MAG: hypothetical protein ACRCU9_05510, partial [Iodobacter sp.]